MKKANHELEEHLNRISYEIIDAAIDVHKAMGPGLLESVYQQCLVKELRRRALHVDTMIPVPLVYKGEPLGKEYVMDILVEDNILLELKAVEFVLPVHKAQIISYLKLSEKPLGFLINFNVPNLKEGLERFVNGL
jgi:GxxExxY protein